MLPESFTVYDKFIWDNDYHLQELQIKILSMTFQKLPINIDHIKYSKELYEWVLQKYPRLDMRALKQRGPYFIEIGTALMKLIETKKLLYLNEYYNKIPRPDTVGKLNGYVVQKSWPGMALFVLKNLPGYTTAEKRQFTEIIRHFSKEYH